MAILVTSPLLVLIIAICSSISVVLLSASPILKLKLIHPRQIYSLEHPHVSGIDEASLERLNYLQAKASGDIMAHISPNTPAAFLVNISIGSPPFRQLLHMDTGSDLLWVQCRPCTNCYSQSLPIFDPSKSSTYHKEACQTSEDFRPRLIFDARTRSCRYSTEYLDGTGSRGTLARETLTFDTIYGEFSSASLPNVVFGCGHDNYGKPEQGTGVLGLGYGKSSLVHRFGSKFSYCLGRLDDPSYPHNVLVIGDTGANILGDTTSLEIENGLYYVRMEAISVGETLLPIEPRVFQRHYQSCATGTIIDTGSSITMLAGEAYELLKENIEDLFDGRFETVREAPNNGNVKMECYRGDIERDLVESGFPPVTFHFSGGAELALDAKSMFLKSKPDVFCLAVVETVSGTMNIIGVSAQQNYNIGYDLTAGTISFESIDCGVLFDEGSQINIQHP